MTRLFGTPPALRYGAGLALGLILAATGCAQVDIAAKDVCARVAQAEANPTVAGPLDALHPHSAAGVLWADLKSGCTNGQPTANVSTDWTALVEEELAALLPTVLPALAGLL